jgi:hypothetical protein
LCRRATAWCPCTTWRSSAPSFAFWWWTELEFDIVLRPKAEGTYKGWHCASSRDIALRQYRNLEKLCNVCIVWGRRHSARAIGIYVRLYLSYIIYVVYC